MPVPAGGYEEPVVVVLPDWAPTVTQVAVYVPKRTLVRPDESTVESDDTYQFTFDTTTMPTSAQVLQLIADGCAWVTARVSPLATSSENAARVCAALYAAAAVERGWPEDDNALQRANDLEKRLDALLTDLIDANNSSNGTGSYGLDIVPQWSFPPADCRWDSPSFW
jgi:hypothetical protein